MSDDQDNTDQQANMVVLAHPKVIYWVDMPDILQPKDRVELLQHDVIIKTLISERISELQKEDGAAYIINLDKYISKNRIGKVPSELALAQRVLHILRTLNPGRSLVHTTIIDPELSKLFKSAGILIIEKNIDSKRGLVPMIGKFVSYLFRDDGRLKRDFVRLQFPENIKHSVTIMNLRTNVPGIKGELRDISLNGLGIKLGSPQQIGFFQLKDPVRLEFVIEKTQYKIKMAFTARVHSPSSEVGFIFNIRNPNMITDEMASNYSGLIYDYLRSISHSEK